MIRINLLGQPRPKARRAAVPAGATVSVVLLVVSVALAGAWIWFRLGQVNGEIRVQEDRITNLKVEKNRLLPIKREVEEYERQKPILERKKAVIDDLNRNKTGGQELLDALASTVTRTEGLWLTGMTKRGAGLTIEGTAGSVNSVANFITQLKRSGYFQTVEIKEARQDTRNTDVTTFLFSLTADFVLPSAAAGPPGRTPAAPAPGKS